MSSPAAALNGLLAGTGSLPTHIESLLDSLTHDERVSAIRSLGRAAQRKLYVSMARSPSVPSMMGSSTTLPSTRSSTFSPMGGFLLIRSGWFFGDETIAKC